MIPIRRTPLTLGGFGSVVALRGRILVASDVRPNDRSSDASLLAYEYDPALKNKWRLVQSDLLSTEGRRRRFGSRVALTNDGEGILVGCRPGADPAEILYFRRRGQADPYGNRSFELRQIITLPERCDVVSDLKVDGSDTLMLGTLNQDRVYVYRRTPDDPNATEDRGQWTLACRVAHKGPERADEFGTNVGLSGDRVLVGSRGDVYAHGLEAWRKASEGRRGFMGRRSSARSRPGPSQGRRRFARSMPPLMLRR